MFCSCCPCAGYCDGNADGNLKATGYSFIPDPDHCKEMFAKYEKELDYKTFFTAIMEIYGSTINNDWKRFCYPEEEFNKLEIEDRLHQIENEVKFFNSQQRNKSKQIKCNPPSYIKIIKPTVSKSWKVGKKK